MNLSIINTVLKKGAVKAMEHLPEMLMVAGTGGLVATVVSAVQATPKAIERKRKAEDEAFHIEGELKRKAYVAARVAPAYLPTVLLGAGTIACFYGSNYLLVKRSAALASMYTALTKTMESYQTKVIERHGEEEDHEIMKEVMHETGAVDDVGDTPDIYEGDGPQLFYDSVTGRWFKSTEANVRAAESYICRKVIDQVTASLNEFYEFLGLSSNTVIGEGLGWDIEHTSMYIEITEEADTIGRPYWVLWYPRCVIDTSALGL